MSSCVQRSQVVALSTVFFFSVLGGSLLGPAGAGAGAAPLGWGLASSITSTGCMLILPYGHSSEHLPQPMHQSSIMISRLSLRRMDPTGHCVMQSGSRQVRQ